MSSGGLADRGGGTFDDSHDVGLLHDQEILAIELDLGAGPLAEQDAVALLDVERNQRALLVASARADRDDLAFHRLFLGGVRNDDATLGLAFFLDALDHDTVVKRTELHVFPPKLRKRFLSALSCDECQWRTGCKGVSCLSQGEREKVAPGSCKSFRTSSNHQRRLLVHCCGTILLIFR